MRGRAATVALPVLVVLALVAVVAIASTGSVQQGSSASRTPSDALLDTLFTLSILAVVAGGVLLVYGLAQRQAVAREMALGRYPRFGLVTFLVWMVCLGGLVLLIQRAHRPQPGPADGGAFEDVITAPTPPTRAEQLPSYEPEISWPIVVAVAVALVASVAHVVARRRRGQLDPHDELALQVAGALDDALDDLRAEPDPRRAIVAAYARLERVLAANGVVRRPSETADEYLARVLSDLALTPGAIGHLTALFSEAKFSLHEVDSTMKESAIAAVEEVRDELQAVRDAREHQAAPAATT
jgi:hypothetical protein